MKKRKPTINSLEKKKSSYYSKILELKKQIAELKDEEDFKKPLPVKMASVLMVQPAIAEDLSSNVLLTFYVDGDIEPIALNISESAELVRQVVASLAAHGDQNAQFLFKNFLSVPTHEESSEKPDYRIDQ